MNIIRTCKRGHLVEGDNAYIQPNGYAQCRICRNAAKAASYHRLNIKHEPRTHCKNGHELTLENLCKDVLLKRRCRICRNTYMRNRALKFKKIDPIGSSRYIRSIKLKSSYGITLEEKEQMIAAQDGKCAICYFEFSDNNKPCTDHNHLTQKVRGILCHACNRAIGLLKDDTAVLENAIKYLKAAEEKLEVY